MNGRIRELSGTNWIPVSILMLATLAVYLRTLGHDFQIFWDDAGYITGNPVIRGFTFHNLKSTFTTSLMGNYAPLHMISYMLDYSIWGLKPAGYFLSNILYHLINGLLFYFLLIRVEWTKPAAFLVAYIFLLHPVQVESVAWASERKNLLAMLFFLLSFVSYLNYRELGIKFGWGRYLLSIFLFVCAVLSKSAAIALPLFLIFYDLCFFPGERFGKRQLDKFPFLLVAGVTAVITILFQAPGDVPGAGGGRVPWHGNGPLPTFLTMLTVLPRYVSLVLMPTGLSAVYDPPVRATFDWAVAGSSVLIIILVFTGTYLFRKKRKIFFWYSFFFMGLLPVSQIVPITTLMNDRYLYFPMLGAAACFGSLAAYGDYSNRWLRTSVITVTFMLALALPSLSFIRAGVWKNDLTLWGDAARKSPNHYLALYGLAQALQNSGDLGAALPLYLKVHDLKPAHLDTLIHLGYLYSSMNVPLKARPYLIEVTRLYPGLASGFKNLGINYYKTDQFIEAEKNLRKSLDIEPNSRDTVYYLGLISLRSRRINDARGFFEKLISRGEISADLEYNLACVESLSGNTGKSLFHLENALKLGFRDRGSLEKDHDLEHVRKNAGFRLIVTKYIGE
jgi:tetratricopeptide (TPR) repeat protein